jgi:hypothetical protein
MTLGTFVLSDAFGLERPSLEPLGTTFLVLIVFIALYLGLRRVTVGNGYVELGPDSVEVRAGLTVSVRVPYEEIASVSAPPYPLVHWEGPVGFHFASQAIRVGAGGNCVEVVLQAPRSGGVFPFPGARYSRLLLGVCDPGSLVDALRGEISRPS